MGHKKHNPKILILSVLMSGSLQLDFSVFDAFPYVCMVPCGRPAAFVWLCKLHTIEDHALCHATVKLAQPHDCGSKAAMCHANSTVQTASNIFLSIPRTNLLYDARCRSYRYVLGTRMYLPGRATPRTSANRYS